MNASNRHHNHLDFDERFKLDHILTACLCQGNQQNPTELLFFGTKFDASVNEKLWKTPNLHADLYVEDRREISDALSKRITLMTSHSGRILGQADIFVPNSQIEK